MSAGGKVKPAAARAEGSGRTAPVSPYSSRIIISCRFLEIKNRKILFYLEMGIQAPGKQLFFAK